MKKFLMALFVVNAATSCSDRVDSPAPTGIKRFPDESPTKAPSNTVDPGTVALLEPAIRLTDAWQGINEVFQGTVPDKDRVKFSVSARDAASKTTVNINLEQELQGGRMNLVGVKYLRDSRTIGTDDSNVLVTLDGVNFWSIGGSVTIERYVSGKVSGKFEVMLVPVDSTQPSTEKRLAGTFEGAVVFGCNIIEQQGSAVDESVSAGTEGTDDSPGILAWTVADISHPFCQRYM